MTALALSGTTSSTQIQRTIIDTPSSVPPNTVPPSNPTDPLAEVDQILSDWSSQRLAFAQRQADSRAARQQFEHDADVLTQTVIRPAFDDLAARLNNDGGGGRVDERPSDGRHTYRLTLWMSLDVSVTEPRQDRNPYLQLDLDVPNQRFNVWEGDMWEKQGSSRGSTPWQLSQITTEAVAHRAIAILRRAASHDVVI